MKTLRWIVALVVSVAGGWAAAIPDRVPDRFVPSPFERQRIEGLAKDRAAANPPTIRDVRFGDDRPGRWWRRMPRPVV